MADPPVSKGRGAALLAMLKKHKEQRELGTPGLDPEQSSAMPPGPRGRAAQLKKLLELKQQTKVGTPTQESEIGQPSNGSGPELVQKVQELTLSESAEPCYFRGDSGRKIKASSNYLRLELEQDRGVFEYEVKFVPEVDAKSNRSKLVYEHLKEVTAKVYDGGSCLYLPTQAYQGRQEFQGVLPNTNEKVTTILIYKRRKKMGDPECLHLYNVLFKRIMRVLLYTRMGQNYFSPDHKYEIPQYKLEIFPGFAVSVDEMEGGLMLCLDTQHRVIRSQTVYQFLLELHSAYPDNFKAKVNESVIGSCVLTKYNNQTYIIDDIDWSMTPQHTFPTKNGEISFVDYYKTQHGLTIDNLDQPMLISRKTINVQGNKVDQMICLVPELSYLTGLSDVMRSDFKVMKEVASFTRVTPNQRMLAIRKYVENVNKSELATNILAGWGLKLSNASTGINARVLVSEKVYFGNNNHTTNIDWNRAVSENKITGPVDVNNWIVFHTKKDERYARSYVELALKLANGMGCHVRNPKLVCLKDDRADSYVRAINENITPETQVAIFICPTLREDRYSAIKKMCCVELPLASQVILSKTLANQNKVRGIVQKIQMQINCKLGGTLWHVPIPLRGLLVVGVDVYHGKGQRSVCGLVASINDSATRWYSEGIFQEREIGDFFKLTFKKALLAHYQNKGEYPSNIVIYRDGVGNGQLSQVKNFELPQFQSALQELNIEATITFIVVQKRINTRIFCMEDGNNVVNPPSGTVVDSDVTRRNYYDFYLVPQTVRQGTVNPTHYIVLHNSSNMLPDHIQRLSYKLCHLYYNWSGTIRVPAPCQYAHKLASLVGQSIKKIPNSSLNNKLYYL